MAVADDEHREIWGPAATELLANLLLAAHLAHGTLLDAYRWLYDESNDAPVRILRAASSRLASSSVAAGPQISRCSSSATAITKAPASRVASSRRSRPASGFHHQPWPACAIRCGSKVHTRRPVAAARSAAVARYRSGCSSTPPPRPGRRAPPAPPPRSSFPTAGRRWPGSRPPSWTATAVRVRVGDARRWSTPGSDHGDHGGRGRAAATAAALPGPATISTAARYQRLRGTWRTCAVSGASKALLCQVKVRFPPHGREAKCGETGNRE